MKNLFYSMMCLSALALSFTACDDDDNKETPNPGGNGGGNGQPTQIATPTLEAQGGKGTFTVKWAAVENAEGYTVNYGDKTENTKATEYVAKNVAAGEYKVRVKATTTKEGYLDSEWAETTVTVEENGEQPGGNVGDGTWTGTWTVNATKKLKFTNNGSEMVDEPLTFEINIATQEFEGDLSGFIFTGWSKLTDDQGNPVPGAALLDETNKKDLCLLSGFQVGETQTPEGSPATIAWLAPGLVNGEQVQFITGQYPAITFNMTDNDHATGTLFEGELQGGGTFKSIALDVFAFDNSSIYFMSDITEFAAGEFTMTKTANAAQAPQKSYVKAFQAPSLLKNLKSIHTNMARVK